MQITVTSNALQCFVTEWGIRRGDSVRIYARYGAGASAEGGYSLGIEKATPKQVAVSCQVYGITFFIEASDAWYLNGRAATLDYDTGADEIVIRLTPVSAPL